MSPLRGLLLTLAMTCGGSAFAQGEFTQAWSPICTLGAEAEDGCEDIRKREILDASDPRWRAIGRVNFANRAQRSHCTGVLVADDLVLTAAHCVYNSARKKWIPPSSIRFAGGYQRGEAQSVSAVVDYHLPPGQGPGFNRDAKQDWVYLKLADPLGQALGHFEIAEGDLQTATVAGYAGLRPHVLSRTGTCSAQPTGDGLVTALCPVMMGDSGAPLLVETPSGLAVAGILSRVAVTPDGIAALFVSARVFNELAN